MPASMVEEIREVLESLAEAARQPDCDPDHAAACDFLLQHLESAGAPSAIM